MSNAMVQLKNVTKKYKKTMAVADCSLTLEKRKIYGTILGTIFFALMLLGLTYAYFYWSNAEEDNTNINSI